MNVRIRVPKGRPLRRRTPQNPDLALAFSALLVPMALMAYAGAAFTLAIGLGWIPPVYFRGIWSHWQVWMALAVILHLASHRLTAYSRRVFAQDRE